MHFICMHVPLLFSFFSTSFVLQQQQQKDRNVCRFNKNVSNLDLLHTSYTGVKMCSLNNVVLRNFYKHFFLVYRLSILKWNRKKQGLYTSWLLFCSDKKWRNVTYWISVSRFCVCVCVYKEKIKLLLRYFKVKLGVCNKLLCASIYVWNTKYWTAINGQSIDVSDLFLYFII